MTVVFSIQIFVIINLLIVGLSHLIQPKIWVDFFQFLHSRGNPGNIFNAMLALGMGSFIISFHLIFSGPMLLVTVYGFLLTIKGLLYLIYPPIGLKSISKVTINKFKWVGAIMILISLFLSYQFFLAI